MGLGPQELLIILAVALLLFGGSRLAGIGKASGRAIREFKEETADLKKPTQPGTGTDTTVAGTPAVGATATGADRVHDRRVGEDRVVEAEIVDPVDHKRI